jgi:hypothetical protein
MSPKRRGRRGTWSKEPANDNCGSAPTAVSGLDSVVGRGRFLAIAEATGDRDTVASLLNLVGEGQWRTLGRNCTRHDSSCARFSRWEHGEGARTTPALLATLGAHPRKRRVTPRKAGVREEQLRVERGSATNRPQQQEWAPAAAAPPAGGG